MDKFTVTRQFRGATYQITVLDPAGIGCGRVRLTVDGQSQAGRVVPYAAAGKTVTIHAGLEKL